MAELYDPYDGPVPAEHLDFYTELGRRFHAARIARGISLEELAALVNATPEQVKKYENAETVFPIFALLPMLKHMGHPAELEPENFNISPE